MYNKEILELFPTPLYTTQLPVELSSIISFLDKQNMDSDSDEANYGCRSKNSYILNTPECTDLKKFILGCVHDFASTSLLYEYEEYKFSQSWISHKHPGQHHTTHSHPNSLISGVFYYGEPDENIPAIKFHKPAGGINASYISPKIKNDKRESKFAWETFSVEFEPGLLVLFPSYLLHSVPLNTSDKVRCSLAFNVVPTIGLGREENLTELLF
jgi:uncharacterized protein (TIGR02466 family)